MYGSSNFGDLLTKFETKIELSEDKPFDEELAHMMKGSFILFLTIFNINGNFSVLLKPSKELNQPKEN